MRAAVFRFDEYFLNRKEVHWTSEDSVGENLTFKCYLQERHSESISWSGETDCAVKNKEKT